MTVPVQLSPVFNALQLFDNGGIPLNGGLLNTYIAGTTTPQVTYQDVDGTTANSNPIVLDSSGRVPAEIWLLQGNAYKFVLTDADGVILGQYDDVIGILAAVVITSENITDALGYVPANVAGQTFTGPIYLAGDPTLDAQAATKSYVDTQITALNTTLSAQIAAVGTEVGQIIWLPYTTIPDSYIVPNGALLDRTTYAVLFGKIGTTFGSGDGSTTFQIPDVRGVFIRGWDNGRGLDAGRTFGSTQTDAFQGHIHSGFAAMAGVSVRGSGSFDFFAIGNPISDGTNGTPRTASETRPVNIALMPFMKYQ